MCNPTGAPGKMKRSNAAPAQQQQQQQTGDGSNNGNGAPDNPPPATPSSLRKLIYLKEWNSVSTLVEHAPHLTQSPDRMLDLPLHEACLQGAPFQVIQTVLSAHPPAIQTRGFCGRLPLHYAAYNKPSLHVIKLLLKHYPDSAAVTDVDGRLPIHLAVVRNAPKQAIQALIDANPKSLYIPNKFGNTPCMLARNDHVYAILKEEESKPRHLQDKIKLEKKLRKNWTMTATGKGALGKTSNKKVITVNKAPPKGVRRTRGIPLQDQNSRAAPEGPDLQPILETKRESIPTPPGTPSGSSTNHSQMKLPSPSSFGKPESPTFLVSSSLPSKKSPGDHYVSPYAYNNNNNKKSTNSSKGKSYTVPYVPPNNNRAKEAILA